MKTVITSSKGTQRLNVWEMDSGAILFPHVKVQHLSSCDLTVYQYKGWKKIAIAVFGISWGVVCMSVSYTHFKPEINSLFWGKNTFQVISKMSSAWSALVLISLCEHCFWLILCHTWPHSVKVKESDAQGVWQIFHFKWKMMHDSRSEWKCDYCDKILSNVGFSSVIAHNF